jgi:putative DNA primase/helicase
MKPTPDAIIARHGQIDEEPAEADGRKPRGRNGGHGAEAQAEPIRRDLAVVAERRKIDIGKGRYTAVAEESEAAIMAAGLDIFAMNMTLVVPALIKGKDANDQPTATPGLMRVEPALMRQFMDMAAMYERAGPKGGRIRSVPPEMIAKLMLARAGSWPYRPTTGIIAAPTLRRDGSLLDREGYDETTGLILLGAPPMKPIPPAPTRKQALEARNLFFELLKEVPFGDVADEQSRALPLYSRLEKSAAASIVLDGVLSTVARGAISTTPIKLITAPTFGSSKSYCVDLVAMIATGQNAPVLAWASRAEENEKRLASVVLSGSPILSIDNLSTDLQGDFLCQLVERPALTIRVLGGNEMRTIAPRLTTFATGNNVRVAGDLTRRVLVCRLDAGIEDPYSRRFSQDPRAMIAADRGEYIRAALVMLRAFLASKAQRLTPLASYEEWSSLVRSTLVWLGCADPVGTMAIARSEDPRRVAAGAVMTNWRKVFDGEEVTVARLIEVTARKEPEPGGFFGASRKPPVSDHAEFFDALVAVSGNTRGEVDCDRLGKWLGQFKDVIIDGLRLEMRGLTMGRRRWAVADLTLERAR